MSAALAGLLGCAAGSSGRDIPVYREYTQPIYFYDEQGELAAVGAAPDLEALQALRDAKARESMMGKETGLELTFGPGGSMFGAKPPVSGMSAPQGEGEDNRREKNKPEKNWLAKSLSLPSLGQASNNPASAAMTVEDKESSWGWLAGEVAERSIEEEPLPEELQMGGELNPFAALEAGLPGQSIASETGAEKAAGEPKSTEPDKVSVPDSSIAKEPTLAAPQSHRISPAMAEMNQTREVLAEFSVGVRPDFAALRESLIPSPGQPVGGASAESSASQGLNLSSRAGSLAAWGTGSRSEAALGSIGAGPAGGAAWGGGWNAQPFAAGGLPSRFEVQPDPTPAPIAPAVTRGDSRPITSSGGYKPAWY